MGSKLTRALAIGAGITSAMIGAQAASAASTITTPYTFSTTSTDVGVAQNGNLSSWTFTSDPIKGSNSSISVRVTAWHADDNAISRTNPYGYYDTVRSATLGLWDGGLGVTDKGTGESTGDRTHQIDNVGGGVDFLMLQFSENVTLSAVTRNMFGPSSTMSEDDAAYWADTQGIIGTPGTYKQAISLAGRTVDESAWGSIATDRNGVSSIFSPNKSASVWLVGASFVDRNDGFKLAAFTANVVSYAPEPASWAMMILGFGAVGTAMRRRKALAPNVA